MASNLLVIELIFSCPKIIINGFLTFTFEEHCKKKCHFCLQHACLDSLCSLESQIFLKIECVFVI